MFVTIPDVCLAVLSRKGQVVGYLPVGRIPLFVCTSQKGLFDYCMVLFVCYAR